MVKQIFFLLLLVTLNAQDFSHVYPEIFQAKHFGNFVGVEIKNLPKSHRLAELVNNNRDFIHHLFMHFSDAYFGKGYMRKLMEFEDTSQVQTQFLNYLKTDTTFNVLLQKTFSRYLNPKEKKDTFSLDQLMDVAVKYFYIAEVKPNGQYSVRVCVGINELAELHKEREPFIEAFVFPVLRDNVGQGAKLFNEFAKGVKLLYKLHLGENNKEKLLRARGAVYLYLFQNEKMRKLLLQEYKKKKKFLPFVLKK